MSHADNLYSADDSDVESFSNELSPTDGYFSSRDYTQDVMVPDPSLEIGPSTAKSKAREAREVAIASSENLAAGTSASPGVSASSPLRVAAPAPSTIYSSSTHTAYTPRSSASSHRREDDLYSETSPLLHTVAPPPAYSAATPQPTLQHFNENYNTIPAHQLESGPREPESMGGPHDFNERYPLWMKQVKKGSRWRICRNVLLVTLVLGLAVGFIVAAVKSGESNPEKSPFTGPKSGNASYCSSGSTHKGDAMPTYEFKSGRELAILQVTGGKNFRGGAARVRTAGEIILRRLPKNQDNQDTGYITFDVWLTEPGITYRLEMDTEVQALKVVTPEFADLSTSGSHCLSIEVTVWIPPNASFETILVEATSLSIRLMDDVDFYVSQQSHIKTYSGDIYFPSKNLSSTQGSRSPGIPPGFSSREIVVGSASGDVTGVFYLYDLVHVETDSGNINIIVLPQPAQRDAVPNSAQLTLDTASGNIICRYPVGDAAKIPDRDYRTNVITRSGGISGDYVIGTEAIFKIISGDLHIIALPTTFEKSTFKTVTNSGTTTINVLEPLVRHQTASPPTDFIDVGEDDPYLIQHPKVAPIESDALATSSKRYQHSLSQLTSSHDCTNGNMKIHYPSAWEGEITAVTVSGNIRVGGDGVRTIRDGRKNWAYHEVVARKGEYAEDASTLDVHGVSGSLDVWVGESCTSSDWCKMSSK